MTDFENKRNDDITDGARFLRRVQARFAALAPGTHSFSEPIGKIRVYFRARIVAQPKKLLFTFHGSVVREGRTAPPFNSFFPELDDTHQVAISDPSLIECENVRVAWFAGNARFDTQFHLRGALRAIATALNMEQTIYFGNSAGGFAALYYSFFAPNSIALVFNPQTRINAYHATAVTQYRTACWPDLTANSQLPSATCADVTSLYAQGFRNTVIYCQSMGDLHHTSRHMLPFVGAIAAQNKSRRFLLYSDYKGVAGHVTDNDAYRDWAQTAAYCPSDSPKDILSLWHIIRNRPKPITDADPALIAADISQAKRTDMNQSVQARPSIEQGFRPDDLATAQRLRAFREIRR